MEQRLMTEEYKPSVLVIEDDLSSEPIWSYIIDLANKRAQYEWVSSGEDAEEKIKNKLQEKSIFDLVICDIFLSDSTTGFDLWQKYHKQLHERMILTSGIDYFTFSTYISQTKETPPIYLKKPLIIEECIEAVYGYLRK